MKTPNNRIVWDWLLRRFALQQPAPHAKRYVYKMKQTVVYMLLAFAVIGCSIEQPIRNSSFGGKYKAHIEIQEKSLIYVTVLDKNQITVASINTGASDAMKWAIGWAEKSNTLVMASSDIGPMAWSEQAGWSSIALTPEIKQYSEILFNEKYK